MSKLVAFLEGVGPDSAGRRISDVFNLSAEQLEDSHDYIQWIFPLTQPSQCVWGAPVMTNDDIRQLRVSAPAQENLQRAEQMMREFWFGNDHWLVPYDHNHLRITRAITALRLLTTDERADQFKQDVQAHVDAKNAPVNKESRRYWSLA